MGRVVSLRLEGDRGEEMGRGYWLKAREVAMTMVGPVWQHGGGRA